MGLLIYFPVIVFTKNSSDMRRLILYVLVFLLAFSCTKNDYAPGNIEIDFQFETLPVDLNIVDNPFITCIIRSETGLESVEMFIQMKDGSYEPYKTEIREFFNPRHCSIHERPVFTDDMVAFIVKATDLGGAMQEEKIVFDVTSKVNAPKISFNIEEIAFTEGEPISEFSFIVTSDADLESVSVELVQSAMSSELVPLIEDFTDVRSFTFLSSDYELNDYDINKVPQLVRVVVLDDYGKTSISTLKINYKALPAPVVTMNQPETAVEFEDLQITGKATSETGITNVECYVMGEGYERLVTNQTIDGLTDYDIILTVSGDDLRDYITALKIVVTDERTKKTESLIPVTVEPVFETIDATDNLVEEIISRQNNEKYATVKLTLPAGANYSISSELHLTKNIKLRSTSLIDKPVITVDSEYTFTTDKAALDIISFENISFKCLKSKSYFMSNKTSEASIDMLYMSGCLLEGYVNSFYRAGARADFISITLENSRFVWNSTGAYTFMHFPTAEGTLSNLRISNSTFTGIFSFHYNNLKNTECNIEIANSTFANTYAANNAYFVNIANASLSGSISLKKNLFGGNNNLTNEHNCRMLRANNLTKDLSDNYCTKSWKTFVDDSTNNSMNFCTILPETEDNAKIFKDYTNNDFTLLPGTTVYNYGIGDTNWIN